MKIALFGVGQMGTCIAHLISEYTDHELITYDKDPITDNNHEHRLFNAYNLYKKNPLANHEIDIVLSSLPYFCNEAVANLATAVGIPYFDLGGSVKVTEEIKEKSLSRTNPVFTDLGLAPGWANIMAEDAFRFFQKIGIVPTEIKMRCGGLPKFPRGKLIDPFRYHTTWSIDGLWNEYVDDCESLYCNEIVPRSSLSAIEENIRFDNNEIWGGVLESFLTSGGASHTLELMKERKVFHCSYKTLRYPGHCNLMRYFLKEKGFSANELVNLFRDPDALDRDIVILDVEAYGYLNKDDINYRRTLTINADDQFSAMQRATSGGFLAAVFSSMHNSIKGPMNYSHVDTVRFNNWIDKMEILNPENEEIDTYV